MRIVLSFALVLFACGPSSKPTNPTPPPGDPGSAAGPGSGEGSDSATPPPAADCMCTQQYEPVCGSDGKTYGNACAAGCAKVEVKSQGECPK